MTMLRNKLVGREAESSHEQSQGTQLYAFGFAFVTISGMVVLCPAAVVSLGFLFGVSLSPALFIIGLILGLGGAYLLVRDMRVFFCALLGIALLVSAFGLLLTTTTDLGFDSLSYHTRAIADLAQGYNPVKEVHEVPWIHHYPKGSWIFQAGIYQLTHSMESTSIINLLGVFISLGCSLMFVSRVKSLPRFIAVVLVVGTTLAPISVVQLTTHYIDGFLGSLALGAFWVVFGYMLGAFPRKEVGTEIVLGCLLLLLSIIKFTGFVFACVLLAVYLIYLLTFHRNAPELKRYATYVAALLAILLVASFSPYAQNTVKYKNPFYPILSSDIHDFNDAPDDRQRPRAYKKVNPVSGLWMSLTEKTKTIDNSHGYHPKFPTSVSVSEVNALGGPDTAIGGNGPLFFLSILIGCVGYFYYLFRKDISRQRKTVSALLVGGVLMCSLAMLETWWARLVPFFAMLPLILLVIISSKKENRLLQGCAMLLSIVLIANTGIVVYATVCKIKENQAVKLTIRNYLHESSPLKFRFDPDAHENVLVSLRRILREFGVEADELPQAQPIQGVKFIDNTTGDIQTRFVFKDDPVNAKDDIATTWEHFAPLQMLFIVQQR